MSGATTDSTSIPITAMDADKVDETTHPPLERPEVNPTNNTSVVVDSADSAAAVTSTTTSLTSTTTTPTTSDLVTPNQPSVTTTTTASAAAAAAVIVQPPSSSSQPQSQRLPYKYDPDKITLRFLFANRDGLTVTVTCNPTDTIGEVKGALISIWPDDVPHCDDGDDLRLICMGKGFLLPDSRTLQDFHIPIFKTHPTPINVSVKPSPNNKGDHNNAESCTKNNKRNQAHQPSTNIVNGSGSTTTNHINANNSNNNHSRTAAGAASSTTPNGSIETGQGCCIIC